MRIVRDRDSSKDIDAQLSKIEEDGEKFFFNIISDCETLTPDTEKSKQQQRSRVERS